MKTKSILTLAVAFAAIGALPALAQKGKRGPFGQIFSREVYVLEPGIESVLMLTEEQKTKIAAALTATIQSPTLAALAPKKGDPDAEAAFEKYNTARVKAEAEYKELVLGILTAEQKETIKKVDAAVKGAVEGVLTAEQKESLAKTRIKSKK
jgi:hypothetical protein